MVTKTPITIGETYSFMNVTCTFVGGIANFSIGNDSAVAEEGITIEPVGEQNKMTIGAGGSGMHNLRAGTYGKVIIRLLKTANENALLMRCFDVQRMSSSLWGKNEILLSENASGDEIVCSGCAFTNPPRLTYAMEGGINEWEFDCLSVYRILGEYNVIKTATQPTA